MGLVEVALIVDFLVESIVELFVYFECLIVDKIRAYPIYLFDFVLKQRQLITLVEVIMHGILPLSR